jgi:hypothetical protein
MRVGRVIEIVSYVDAVFQTESQPLVQEPLTCEYGEVMDLCRGHLDASSSRDRHGQEIAVLATKIARKAYVGISTFLFFFRVEGL